MKLRNLLALGLCTVTLGGCGKEIVGDLKPTVNLPPRTQIIGNAEPKPALRRGDNLSVALLKTDAALNRANITIRNGGSNYDRLRDSFALGE